MDVETGCMAMHRGEAMFLSIISTTPAGRETALKLYEISASRCGRNTKVVGWARLCDCD